MKENRVFIMSKAQRLASPDTTGLPEKVPALNSSNGISSLAESLPHARLFGDAFGYTIDALQRSVLFWDVMRKAGNQFVEHAQMGKPPVLSFDYEVVMDGRTLEQPCNYLLLRILPEDGAVADPVKRPFVIVDPRAGHGPGIGGFKPDSQIGRALATGHPCYFISFLPDPVTGQTLADVGQAEALFIERVSQMHPEALGKPCVIGNCQAGWAVMALGAVRPGLMGPLIIAGSPLSYWAGVKGQNPMRYLGGLLGGTWLTSLANDLGNGRFDGTYLVNNFEQLNPGNSFWGKSYNLYSKVDTEEPRYLDFEKWWSGFFMLNAEEIQAITDELFVGNKLTSGELVTADGQRVDLRNIRSPILAFASFGDNITPPQQALGWIIDLYDSIDDIRSREQTIIYNLHHDIGHLGIFVSGKIARKETAEFVENIDLIDLLPPGLYELIIEPKDPEAPGAELVEGEYITRFEPRTLDDIRAYGGNDPEDDLRFAAVKRVSEINRGLYEMLVGPWVRALTTEQSAELLRIMSPSRSKYYLLSDLNPFMRIVQSAAETVREHRRPVARDNPFVIWQDRVSHQIVKTLDGYRDTRDATCEAFFLNVYGSPLLQALVGLRAPGVGARPPRAGDEAHKALIEKRVVEIKARVDQGGGLAALLRILIHIHGHDRGVDERTFQMVRKLRQEYPNANSLPMPQLRETVREQVFLMELDREQAMTALPTLLPSEPERHAVLAVARRILEVQGPLDPDEEALMRQVEGRLGVGGRTAASGKAQAGRGQRQAG